MNKIVFFVLLNSILWGGYSFYHAPKSFNEIVSVLRVEDCESIEGFYEVVGQTELMTFSIDHQSNQAQNLIDLLKECSYRSDILNLLPAEYVLEAEENDVVWSLDFDFKNVKLKDEGRSSSLRISIGCIDGMLWVSDYGVTTWYSVSNMDEVTQKLLELVQ